MRRDDKRADTRIPNLPQEISRINSEKLKKKKKHPLTVDDLTRVIKNSIDSRGIKDQEARAMAQHFMDFFGYSGRIIDNILESRDVAGREVKISRKLSLEKFADIYQSDPQRIVISKSIIDQSKSLGILIDMIKHAYERNQMPPSIEVVSKEKGREIIEPDWVDPMIRSFIGSTPLTGSKIQMKLLDLGATSEERAVPIWTLTKEEMQELPNLLRMEHILLTHDLGLRLTELGTVLARGAKKLYKTIPSREQEIAERI